MPQMQKRQKIIIKKIKQSTISVSCLRLPFWRFWNISKSKMKSCIALIELHRMVFPGWTSQQPAPTKLFREGRSVRYTMTSFNGKWSPPCSGISPECRYVLPARHCEVPHSVFWLSRRAGMVGSPEHSSVILSSTYSIVTIKTSLIKSQYKV